MYNYIKEARLLKVELEGFDGKGKAVISVNEGKLKTLKKEYRDKKNYDDILELVEDSSKSVIEEGIGIAFNEKQVNAISKKLNRFFAKSSIIVSEDNGIFTIQLCHHIIPLAKEIMDKARLLKQFCLNNEKNREILCSATSVYHLERLCRDIFINC